MMRKEALAIIDELMANSAKVSRNSLGWLEVDLGKKMWCFYVGNGHWPLIFKQTTPVQRLFICMLYEVPLDAD
jgi:hypothetical protein